MFIDLLKSFSDSDVNTEVRPVEVATILDLLPEDFSHLNLADAELHSPATNAAIFSTGKGSVSVVEYGEQVILYGMKGLEKAVILDKDTPLERVRLLILRYLQ